MTNPLNIESVLKCGVDLMGFIFYPPSKRYIGNTGLSDWIHKNLDAFGRTKRVGVFVNTGIDDLLNQVHDYQLDLLQYLFTDTDFH